MQVLEAILKELWENTVKRVGRRKDWLFFAVNIFYM